MERAVGGSAPSVHLQSTTGSLSTVDCLYINGAELDGGHNI